MHFLFLIQVVPVFEAYSFEEKDTIIKRTLSNFDKISELIGNDVFNKLKSNNILPQSHIYLYIPYFENNWIFRQSITSKLIAEGYSIQLDSINLEDNLYKFEFYPLKTSVQYKKVSSNFFKGTEKIERSIFMEYSYSIIFYNLKTVIQAGVSSLTSIDTIYVNDIQEIESPSFSFTQGTVIDDSFIHQYLAPMIILISTGIIIYLFFHIRS